jgi:endonuclease YncB( thermonuclease family)
MNLAKLIISLFILGLFFTACGPSRSPQKGALPRLSTPDLPTAIPSTQPTPANTRVLALVTPTITPTITPIPAEATGLVVDVISGDTIAIVFKGDKLNQTYLVRYLGIESPPNSLSNPWGIVAYEANRELTRLKVVRLVRDKSEVDAKGDLLRYVYLGNTLLNQTMLERGLARAVITEPDVAQRATLTAAEALARQSVLGLWGPAPTATVVRVRSTPITSTISTPPSQSLNLATSTPYLTVTATIEATATVVSGN